MQRFIDYWNGDGTWQRLSPGERWELAQVAGKMNADVRTALSACPDAEQLSAVQCPALIVSGERSPKPARRAADLLAGRIVQASRVTLTSAGHMAPVRQPELTAECIQTALRTESRLPQQAAWQRAAA